MSTSGLLIVKFCKTSPLGETQQSVQGISASFLKTTSGPTIISKISIKKNHLTCSRLELEDANLVELTPKLTLNHCHNTEKTGAP